MLKKIFFLSLAILSLVIIESALSYFIDTRWRPDLCLLAVIFTTLSLGFRYGFAAALAAGVLKECLAMQTMGLMLVPYLACAFLTDYLKRHMSLQESFISRLGIVTACLLLQIIIQTIFFAGQHSLEASALGMSIILPQVIITLMCVEVFFNICRSCASRLFV